MDNLKKINKILFITLFVFSIGVFGSYSKTTSKYVIDEYDNIVNKTDFKILTNSSNSIKTSGIFKDNKAIFDFTFYRKAITDDEAIEEDTIEISFEGASINKCKIKDDGIEGFVSKNGTNFYNKTNKGVKFTYKDTTSNTTINKSVKVTYECEVDDSILTEDDYVQTRFIGVEKIKIDSNTSEAAFQIFRKTATTEEKYVAPTPDDPIYLENYKKLQFKDKTLTSTLLREWISKYVETYYKDIPQDISLGTYETVLSQYIAFNTTSWNPNSIKGLTYDSTTKTYSFDDNIINYANTLIYANKTVNTDSLKRLYFKKPAGREFTSSEIDNMFKEYYYKYYCESTPTADDEDMLNYIVKKGGVSSVILEKNGIVGIIYNSDFDFVTIRKDLISLRLHPLNPDIILDGSNISIKMQQIVSGVSDFVDKNLGIKNFNDQLILSNRYLYDYIYDINTISNPNSYYYMYLGNGEYLSMRVYKDGKDYIMHLDAFEEYALETKVDKHALTSVDNRYKLKPSVDSSATVAFDEFKTEFIKYIKALDNTYGTSFEVGGAINELNNAISTIVDSLEAGQIKSISGIEFIEPTKKASINIRFVMTSRSAYATFLIEFDPNSITTTATTNTVTANTTKTTSTTKSAPTTLTTTVKTTTKE